MGEKRKNYARNYDEDDVGYDKSDKVLYYTMKKWEIKIMINNNGEWLFRGQIE